MSIIVNNPSMLPFFFDFSILLTYIYSVDIYSKFLILPELNFCLVSAETIFIELLCCLSYDIAFKLLCISFFLFFILFLS